MHIQTIYTKSNTKAADKKVPCTKGTNHKREWEKKKNKKHKIRK